MADSMSNDAADSRTWQQVAATGKYTTYWSLMAARQQTVLTPFPDRGNKLLGWGVVMGEPQRGLLAVMV